MASAIDCGTIHTKSSASRSSFMFSDRNRWASSLAVAWLMVVLPSSHAGRASVPPPGGRSRPSHQTVSPRLVQGAVVAVLVDEHAGRAVFHDASTLDDQHPV